MQSILNEEDYKLTLMLFGTITRWPVSSDCVVAVAGTTADESAADFSLLPAIVAVDGIVVIMSSLLVA